MTAVKTHQADQFIKSLDSRYRAVLFYGPDAGLVSERARMAAQRLAAASNPPGDVLRIEDADLEMEPDRLLVEAQTVPMFGGPKVVHTRASRRVTAQVLKPLLEQETLAASLVVEAGNLRPDDSLRQLFEKSPKAAAVACFEDEGRDLASLVRETLREAGLSIDPEALQLLVSRLGADRALTRGELEKLVLYTRGKTRVEGDDIDAVVGDASELALEKVVLAAASGEADRALTELDRILASGESAQTVIVAVQRHFHRLHRLRTSIDAGATMESALKQLRPPVHFKVRPVLEAQCRTWTTPMLQVALTQIADTAKRARLNASLEIPLTERLLLDLARNAADRRPGRPR